MSSADNADYHLNFQWDANKVVLRLTKAQRKALSTAQEQDGYIDLDNRLRFGHGNNFLRTLDCLTAEGLLEELWVKPGQGRLWRLTPTGMEILDLIRDEYR